MIKRLLCNACYLNNPVKNIDPDGMDIWSTTDPGGDKEGDRKPASRGLIPIQRQLDAHDRQRVPEPAGELLRGAELQLADGAAVVPFGRGHRRDLCEPVDLGPRDGVY